MSQARGSIGSGPVAGLGVGRIAENGIGGCAAEDRDQDADQAKHGFEEGVTRCQGGQVGRIPGELRVKRRVS